MTEILKLGVTRNQNWSIKEYSDKYHCYLKALRAGDMLFNLLQRVFLKICNEINVPKEMFEIDEESAEKLFSETFDWMFPEEYENVLSAENTQKEYCLIWHGKDKSYRYTVAVATRAIKFNFETTDDVVCSGKILREDKIGNAQVWYAKEQIWLDYKPRKTQNIGN